MTSRLDVRRVRLERNWLPVLMSADRSIYEAQAMEKDNLSKFVKDAARWPIFDRTVQVVKERNQDISPEILETMIDDAVREVRAECHPINGE